MDFAATRHVDLGPLDCEVIGRPDGSVILRNVEPLSAYPRSLTSWLAHWAAHAPDRVYLARRGRGGEWVRVTYAEAYARVRSIAAALLSRDLSAERPVAILSGNGIEHALLALAAMHVGIAYVPISVAYSLVSTDYGKLRHIIGLTTPGLVFVDDGGRYDRAIAAAVPEGVELVVVDNPVNTRPSTSFVDLAGDDVDAVDRAAARVDGDTVAKLLFTSGSTGLPKGVINTQRMLCANQIMIRQSLAFLAETPPVLVDWTPWNHTFGGNHDFGLILANGGTLYIDDGKPTPAGIGESIRNLREIAPTFYLNVPKGYEELVGYLEREPDLRRTFFSRLQLLFYAGAGLSQHVWDRLDAVAIKTLGARVPMTSGFGSTETAPFALVCRPGDAKAGMIGLPCAGIEVKLAPVEEKYEGRIRGPNVTPGYWRNPEQTAKAFDEEGFYRFGDAFRWADPANPDKGLAFDGRLTEDFKLATGTWVSVGPMRSRILAAFAPLAVDAVVTGLDRDWVGALLVPDLAACRALAGECDDPLAHPVVLDEMRARLRSLASTATGSATKVTRVHLLREPPRIDTGEITDKGSLNQRAMLSHRAALVDDLYATPTPAHVIVLENTP